MESGLPPEETTRVAHATRLAVINLTILAIDDVHRANLTDEI